MSASALLTALLLVLLPAPSYAHPKSDRLTAAGRAAADAGEIDRAIGYFEKALEDWPNNRAARIELERALREAQRRYPKSQAHQP